MATKSINANTTTGRTTEQQAELDRMRKAKAHAKTVQPEPAAATEEELGSAEFDFEAFIRRHVPSGRRALAALIVPMLLAAGLGWAVSATLTLMCMALSLGIIMSVIIWIVGLAISVYAGMKIGEHVGGYILSGQIDRDAIAAKDKVVGWFGAAKNLVTKQPVTVSA